MSYFYRACAKTSAELYGQMRSNGAISSEKVYKVLVEVDRKHFVSLYIRDEPLVDRPESIGKFNSFTNAGFSATISAPHMHAIALENLESKLVPGARVLDVGSGSGYLTVCMAKMIERNGRVTGIDHIEDLVENSRKSIINAGYGDFLKSGQVRLVVGDGRAGFPEDAPYDAIHVGAASTTIPKQLTDQLAVNGVMLIPVDNKELYCQDFCKVVKVSENEVRVEKLFQVSYIPLTDKDTQLSR